MRKGTINSIAEKKKLTGCIISCEKASEWDYFSIEFFFGTGSYPCVPQGWQREIRFVPSQIPLNTPHSWIASIVYCEHDGEWRQCVPNMGESVN